MTTGHFITSCTEINVNSEQTLNVVSSHKCLQSQKSTIHNFTFTTENELFKTNMQSNAENPLCFHTWMWYRDVQPSLLKP